MPGENKFLYHVAYHGDFFEAPCGHMTTRQFGSCAACNKKTSDAKKAAKYAIKKELENEIYDELDEMKYGE